MISHRFKKESKLIKADEFSSVFNFRKRYTTQYVVIHYQPNDLNQSRLGLVASKKVAKSAVVRNYMRRVIRECFRQNPLVHTLSYDFVIRINKPFNPAQFKQVNDDFNQCIFVLNNKKVNVDRDNSLI